MKSIVLIFLLFWGQNFLSQEKVVIRNDDALPLNPHLIYAVSEDISSVPKMAENEVFNTVASLEKYSDQHPKIKSIWAKLVIENTTADSIFYIHSLEPVAELELFQLLDGKIHPLRKTGFNISRSKLPLKKGDIYHLQFTLPKNTEKTFLLQSKSYKNSVYFPNIEILSHQKYLKSVEKFFYSENYDYYLLALFFIGIHFCLALLAMSRLRAKQFKLALVVFIGINIFYIIYYLAEYEFVDYENEFFPKFIHNDYVNFLGAIETGLYYLFFWSYLDKYGTSWFRKAVLWCSLFWLAFYFIVNTEWQNELMISASVWIRNFGPLFDLIVTGSVFMYLLKYKSTFYRFARIGVFILLISAVQLSLPYFLGLIGIEAEPPKFISDFSYLIMQIAIVLDFILFLYGQNRNELELQIEADEAKQQLLLQKLERQKSIEKERERISHDMHDDLGAGISAMKLQAEYLKSKIPGENAAEDINDLIKTAKEINISMREILWSLNSKNDSVGNLVEYSALYIENFFRKTTIGVHIEKHGIKPETEISAEKRRNMLLCIKEAINNIYKHSLATTAEIFFEQENQLLKITIKDNGIGIPSDGIKGNGINNMEFRMREIGGTFTKKTSSFGTVLSFGINLQKNNTVLP